jgi:hypothetical protein
MTERSHIAATHFVSAPHRPIPQEVANDSRVSIRTALQFGDRIALTIRLASRKIAVVGSVEPAFSKRRMWANPPTTLPFHTPVPEFGARSALTHRTLGWTLRLSLLNGEW